MPHYGPLTAAEDVGTENRWLIEFHDDGTPQLDIVLIRAEERLDFVPVWSVKLPITGDLGTTFTEYEAGEIALLMMRTRLAEPMDQDPGG